MNICNALAMVIMVYFCFSNLKPVKMKVKNLMGRVDFSDTCVLREGKAAQIVPRWDVAREVKHRVWHETKSQQSNRTRPWQTRHNQAGTDRGRQMGLDRI